MRAADIARAASDPTQHPIPQFLKGKIFIGMALTLIRLLGKKRHALNRYRALKDRDNIARVSGDIDAIRQQVQDALLESKQIYSSPANQHGLSTVSWVRGLLALSDDRFDDARDLAQDAWTTAHGGDRVARARAKQLESQAELAAAEASERPERCQHHREALISAREALRIAELTQHTRLIGRSQVCLAAALTFDGQSEHEHEALHLIDEAKRSVPPAPDDYLWATLLGVDASLQRARASTSWLKDLIARAADPANNVTLEALTPELKYHIVRDVSAARGCSFDDALRFLRVGGGLARKLLDIHATQTGAIRRKGTAARAARRQTA